MPGSGSWTHRCIVSFLTVCASVWNNCCVWQYTFYFVFSDYIKCTAVLSKVCLRDYPMMLSVFSNLLSKESDLRVIDNLCAALCRMIMSNVDAVPLEQVCYIKYFS